MQLTSLHTGKEFESNIIYLNKIVGRTIRSITLNHFTIKTLLID